MENRLSLENVDSHGTRTYRTDDSARESVLVVVPSELVGSDNNEPPNPYEFNFGHELRSAYYNTGKNTVAQFPRWSNEYRNISHKSPLSDIVVVERKIVGIYQKTDDEAFCVTWDVFEDSWDSEYTQVDDYSSLAHTMGAILWSSIRSRETASLTSSTR